MGVLESDRVPVSRMVGGDLRTTASQRSSTGSWRDGDVAVGALGVVGRHAPGSGEARVARTLLKDWRCRTRRVLFDSKFGERLGYISRRDLGGHAACSA